MLGSHRFQGRLSELLSQFDVFSFFTTRWVGALYRFTSGNIPSRLIINQTPQSIMTVLADAAGLATGERDFDTSTDEWNRELSPGYAGVQEVQSMVNGFIYDAPDYKVRLELPATRAAKAVVARYTDGDPTAAELGVPPPRRLTRPFGIINHVDGEIHVAHVASSGSDITVHAGEMIWDYSDLQDVSFTIPVPNYIEGNVALVSWSLTFGIALDNATYTAETITAGEETLTVTSANPMVTLAIDTTRTGYTARRVGLDNFVVTFSDGALRVSMRIRGLVALPPPLTGFTSDSVEMLAYPVMRGSFFVVSGGSFMEGITTYNGYQADNLTSRSRYGYRARPSPLIVAQTRTAPPPPGFIPDDGVLTQAMCDELATYSTPTPIFEIERACDTADHRADILARRLSDKVRLTADGPSMLGFDGDCFVEAIQTTIRPTGELTQTLWIEEA